MNLANCPPDLTTYNALLERICNAKSKQSTPIPGTLVTFLPYGSTYCLLLCLRSVQTAGTCLGVCRRKPIHRHDGCSGGNGRTFWNQA